MKLLISAYACEPEKGSEAGVGWHWVIEVARLGHDVWVLTRGNNRSTIQRVLPDIANLRFVYYDLPQWAARLKKRGPFLSLYYLLWQWGAYRSARELHWQVRFDAVQHLTFGAFRYPSFMGRLGTRFVFGPVGGGERSPMRLRRDYGVKGQIIDGLRDLANLVAPFNPWLNETFNAAELILVKTPQTRAALPRRYREKTICAIEIGAPERIQHDSVTAPDDGAIRFLFVGRFLFWKGGQYALRAFARLLQEVPNARLTMVGVGPDGERWHRLCQRLDVTHAVGWHGWMEQAKLGAIYAEHHAFLFPSLHDSSGNVVLEAMAHGLPVVCFDLGGPGVLVTDRSGIVIPTTGQGAEQLVVALTEVMKSLADDPRKLHDLQIGAVARARELTWEAAVRKVYGQHGLLSGLS